jgi:kynurenine formamidase
LAVLYVDVDNYFSNVRFFRNILGVAVDVISIDRGQSKDFKTHQILSDKNIWGVENLANADKLPAAGFTIYNMVYRLQEGSGAPTRIFAILDEKGGSINGAENAFLSFNLILVSLLTLLFF